MQPRWQRWKYKHGKVVLKDGKGLVGDFCCKLQSNAIRMVQGILLIFNVIPENANSDGPASCTLISNHFALQMLGMENPQRAVRECMGWFLTSNMFTWYLHTTLQVCNFIHSNKIFRVTSARPGRFETCRGALYLISCQVFHLFSRIDELYLSMLLWHFLRPISCALHPSSIYTWHTSSLTLPKWHGQSLSQQGTHIRLIDVMESTFDVRSFKLPGEYQYRGILYTGLHTPKVHIDMLKSWQVDPTDVVIATYPKSGKPMFGPSAHWSFYLWTSVVFTNVLMLSEVFM